MLVACLWSIYEIIHICTADVDESEEWSIRFCLLCPDLNPANPSLQCSFPLFSWHGSTNMKEVLKNLMRLDCWDIKIALSLDTAWLLSHMTSECMQMKSRICIVHKLHYACCSCFPNFSLSLLHFGLVIENFFFLQVLLLEGPFLPNIIIVFF